MDDGSAAHGLLGRDELVRTAVRRMSAGPRLLSVAGRRGAGTTSVALAVAQALPGPFHLVAPAPSARPGCVPVLDDLDPDGAPTPAAAAALRATGGTVVLDGCRTVAAATRSARQLLAVAPHLTVVVTAPARLELPEEVVLNVPPLDLPTPDEDDPGVLAAAPAVALFLAAAERAAAGADVAEADLPAVAEICRQLDGLPLGITLAAARTSLMRPGTMLEEMARIGPWQLVGLSVEGEVQQALDALDAPALAVARALATTADGASFQALSALADLPESEVVTALSSLLDRQLVVADQARGRVAITSSAGLLLRRRWAGEPVWERCLDRHATWYGGQARAFSRRPHGAPVDSAWVLDHRNRLAALARLQAGGDTAGALRLAVDAMPGFEHRGEPDDGRRLLAEVLGDAGDSTSGACIGAHLWLGRLEAEHADGLATGAARAHLETARRLAAERGHLVLHLEALNAVAENQVVLEDGVALCERAVAEGLSLTQGAGLELGRAVFLAWHSANLHRRGRLDEAVSALAEALDTARAVGDRRLLMGFSILCWQLPPEHRGRLGGFPATSELLDMAEAQGDVRAEGWVLMVAVGNAVDDGDERDAAIGALALLRLARRTGQRPLARQSVAAVLRLLGRHPRADLAAVLAGALSAHAEGVRAHLPPRWVADLEDVVVGARADLGSDAFEALHRTGERQPFDQVLDGAEQWLRDLVEEVRPVGFTGRATAGRRPLTSSARPVSGPPLTPRETDVLLALARGQANKEVARALGLRTKTVAHHCAAIYAKLGVRNRTEAVTTGIALGLLDTERA